MFAKHVIESSTEESLNEDPIENEPNLDTKLQAAVRWIIYIITYALAVCFFILNLLNYNRFNVTLFRS